MQDNIQQKVSLLPTGSGVYQMFDAEGKIIYIGKAKNLKNRVSQYFLRANHNQKVSLMVANVADFCYILCNSESDALLLEANLIKKHKPKYNILLKDDKYFPYIKIDYSQKFPTVEVARKMKKDDAKYYGPYLNGVPIHQLLEIIQSAFPIRNCVGKLKDGKTSRGCLNRFTNRCVAPCTGNVSQQDYLKIIDEVVKFLKGDFSKAQKHLTQKMHKSAQAEMFENALKCKEQLEILQKLQRQPMRITSSLDFDVFSFVSNGEFATIGAVFVREGIIIGSKNYEISQIMMDEEESFRNFLYSFYQKSAVVVDEVLINMPLDVSIEKCKVVLPKAGIKKQLVDMAMLNARDYLTKNLEQIKRKEESKILALSQLKNALNLSKLPNRIECYDISNISGTDKTASMVVCIDGVMQHNLYRKFKIKTVEGSNDFASLHEVILRRLDRLCDKNESDDSFSQRPDLVVIDGGKGQLSAVYDLLCKQQIDTISLAKREEEIFLPNTSQPIVLEKSNLALRLLQRIRDESHRFAISFHRSLRQKHMESILEQIEGVGKIRRKNILQKFETENSLKNAREEELMQVEGISQKVAQNIINFFREEK